MPASQEPPCPEREDVTENEIAFHSFEIEAHGRCSACNDTDGSFVVEHGATADVGKPLPPMEMITGHLVELTSPPRRGERLVELADACTEAFAALYAAAADCTAALVTYNEALDQAMADQADDDG